MRLAMQKKVNFMPEQLSFNMNVDNTGLFAGEQPAPIMMTKPGKIGSKWRSNSKSKRSVSAKPRKPPSVASGKQTYD